MLYDPVNGTIPMGSAKMDYIAFGSGAKHLVMIPGLGEGLQSIKGTALPFALLYRKLAKDYRVTVFARRNPMPPNFTTRDMAEDIYRGMQHLGIDSARVIGISLGGMIVQHLALDHPEAVEKLILTVTLPHHNDMLVECLSHWCDLAHQGDFPEIMADTARRSYTPERLRKQGLWMYRLLGRFVKRENTQRFLTMAQAGIAHDAAHRLQEITCPTLIIGGRQDMIVDGRASEELHRLIPGSSLHMYEDYGHGLYEEAPDFIDRIMDFFD